MNVFRYKKTTIWKYIKK